LWWALPIDGTQLRRYRIPHSGLVQCAFRQLQCGCV